MSKQKNKTLNPSNPITLSRWDPIKNALNHVVPVNVSKVTVPMRDGIKLYGTLYAPKEGDCWPVILEREPYVAQNIGDYPFPAMTFPKNGYAFLQVEARGTQHSEGEWHPFIHEREDGFDTIDWVSEQPWCNGQIATWGGSYLGFTQWAILDSDNPALKTHYIDVYGCDPMQMHWRRGNYRMDIFTNWAAQQMGENQQKMWAGPFNVKLNEAAFSVRPPMTLGEELIGEPCEWYKIWCTTPDPKDPYWDKGTLGEIRRMPERATRPIAMHAGYFDIFFRMQMEGWRRLPKEVKEQSHLLLRPCVHQGMTTKEYPGANTYGMMQLKDAVSWFDHVMKGKPYDGKVGSMQAYCMGEGKYHDLPLDFPETKSLKFYFGKNTLEEKKTKAGDFTYTYDPDDPVESVGGNLIANNRNPNAMTADMSVEQPKPGYRDDVITFFSPKLKKKATIAGKMIVELYVSSDCPATAFTVKVSEDKNGKSYNITDDITDIRYIDETTIRDYKPGEVRKLTFELLDTYWELKKGSRIRVDISSSNSPAYGPHMNTVRPWGEEDTPQIAHNTVYFGGKNKSNIVLPLVK